MRIFSTLPGLLLLLLLALPTVASPPNALGPRRDSDEMGAGGLLFKTADGLREAPTLATDVEITITAEDIEERRDVAVFRAIDVLRGEDS